MKRVILVLVLGAVLLLAVAASAAAAAPQVYQARLDPLNGSGVSGIAIFTVKGGELRSVVAVHGLEPGQVHMQHIHGMADGSLATCPPAIADVNGDGLISFAEGLPFYGPVLLPLQPYPTANPGGSVNTRLTFSGNQLANLQLDTVPLTDRVVVVHGMTVNGTYDMTLPVACGPIEEVR
jgi:hypothetical protein